MNNKNLKTLLVAALACTAFCGTTLAAPHRGNAAPRNDRAMRAAPAPKTAHRTAPAAHHTAPARHHAAPAPHHHPAPPRYAHHAPPPPPPPPRPATVVVAHEEPGLLTAGACLLGAVFGAVLGAAF